MTDRRGFWRDCGIPVVVSMSAFCILNYLWNSPALALYEVVPQAIPVYMVGGSLLSLVFLWDVRRRGVLSLDGAGLAPGGWKPWKRIFGLALIIFFAYGGLTTLPDVVKTPSWGDYLFWFIFLLPASIAELLVFITLAYCLPEAWLRRHGMGVIGAAVLSAIFAGVTFGLYHYTHEPRWHQYALQLIPIMWINLFYFATTRNFHITLVLHNAFAAVGFAGEQYKQLPPETYIDPVTFQKPLELTCLIIGFVVPFLILQVMEGVWWRQDARAKDDIAN